MADCTMIIVSFRRGFITLHKERGLWKGWNIGSIKRRGFRTEGENKAQGRGGYIENLEEENGIRREMGWKREGVVKSVAHSGEMYVVKAQVDWGKETQCCLVWLGDVGPRVRTQQGVKTNANIHTLTKFMLYTVHCAYYMTYLYSVYVWMFLLCQSLVFCMRTLIVCIYVCVYVRANICLLFFSFISVCMCAMVLGDLYYKVSEYVCLSIGMELLYHHETIRVMNKSICYFTEYMHLYD